MQEKIELLMDVQTSLQQIDNGQGLEHTEAYEPYFAENLKMNIIWSPFALDRVSEIAQR